mgnify:CR=1 FL=1
MPLKKIFILNTLFFILFALFFYLFPRYDITFSNFFFTNNLFISEKYQGIKYLRSFLKDLMVIFPVTVLLLLIIHHFFKEKYNMKQRMKYALIGFIIGPIIGSGLIANFFFKDNWGRARPIQVSEFGGDKSFTPAFVKTDQCEKNCSWISGESSAAFSFFVGSLILKNPIFLYLNLIIGVFVSFCRISMGGHFLSDNIFAFSFMVYLAIVYKFMVIKFVKKK